MFCYGSLLSTRHTYHVPCVVHEGLLRRFWDLAWFLSLHKYMSIILCSFTIMYLFTNMFGFRVALKWEENCVVFRVSKPAAPFPLKHLPLPSGMHALCGCKIYFSFYKIYLYYIFLDRLVPFSDYFRLRTLRTYVHTNKVERRNTDATNTLLMFDLVLSYRSNFTYALAFCDVSEGRKRYVQ